MDAEELKSQETNEEAQEQEQGEVSQSELIEDVLQDETPAEPEIDPKDAVIGDYRRQAREQRADNEALRQQIAEQGRAIEDLRRPQDQPGLSPIDKLAAEDPLATPDAGTLAAQDKWVRERDAKASETAATEAQRQTEQRTAQDRKTTVDEAQVLARKDLSTESMGMGLDLETVLSAGAALLTEGESLDIRKAPSDKLWQLAYSKCMNAILASGTAQAKLFAQRQAAHKAAPKAAAEEPVPGTPPAGQKEGGPLTEFAHITGFLSDGDDAD